MAFPGSNTQTIFLAIAASIALTLITGQLSIRAALWFEIVDVPGSAPHKKHHRATPLAGGIALMLAFVPLVFLFGVIWNYQVAVMLFASGVIFLFGLWDDKAGLDAPKKLTGQLLACLILLTAGLEIQVLKPSFLGIHNAMIVIWLNRALTILWVVGVTNAFNLADSMDGLVAGLSGWGFAFFILAMLDSGQFTLAVLAAILAGICFSLFFYNSPEARLFLGDSGAQTLGFILAVMAILYTPANRPQLSSWYVPIMLVGVPIFDTSLVFFSRLKRGIPFYKANCDHSYHRLVALGLDSNRAVLTMHMAALLLDCLAFVALSLPPLFGNLIFAACVFSAVIIFLFFERILTSKI